MKTSGYKYCTRKAPEQISTVRRAFFIYTALDSDYSITFKGETKKGLTQRRQATKF